MYFQPKKTFTNLFLSGIIAVWQFRRGSSTVEHGFRKAGVEGSNPFFGCMLEAVSNNPVPAIPPTEGVKYAGSKLKLLPHILALARNIQADTVFDGFSGSTRVSQMFAGLGYRVISNDTAVWSKVFAQCYLLNERPAAYYQPIIDHLNHLPGSDGWFTEHYGGDFRTGKGPKKPWQIHNTRKLDAIREEIDKLALPEIEKAVLLTSLILAMDEVDSTLGHYASYLNQWSSRSYKTMRMQVPSLILSDRKHAVLQEDVLAVCDKIECDLAYFDPPYGSNNEKMPPSRIRYAAYYHLWTTICLNDHPAIFGKVNRRTDSSDTIASSVFEDFRKGLSGRFIVVEAIEKLIQNTRARYIILSYSTGGRATAQELQETLEHSGRIREIINVDYKKNVMANMRWTNQWIRQSEQPNKEFLFLLEKT
jgi:adenine-specific DNA-methyltransferase